MRPFLLACCLVIVCSNAAVAGTVLAKCKTRDGKGVCTVKVPETPCKGTSYCTRPTEICYYDFCASAEPPYTLRIDKASAEIR
jgi:hypothetical protein